MHNINASLMHRTWDLPCEAWARKRGREGRGFQDDEEGIAAWWRVQWLWRAVLEVTYRFSSFSGSLTSIEKNLHLWRYHTVLIWLSSEQTLGFRIQGLACNSACWTHAKRRPNPTILCRRRVNATRMNKMQLRRKQTTRLWLTRAPRKMMKWWNDRIIGW